MAPADPQIRDAMSAAKLRKEEAQARRLETICRKLEGALVDRAEVEAAWCRVCAAFRSLLLGVPARVGPVVVGLGDAVEAERIVRLELEEVLRQLADRPVVEAEDAS